MKRFFFLFVWAFSFPAFLLLYFSSCTKDKGEPLPVLDCGDTSSITYTNYVNTILANNCSISGCHNSSFVGYDYTNYSGIKGKVDNGSFVNRVLLQKNMPPSYSTGPTSLDPCTLQKLSAWVNDGAPE
jgi:hypothetical protein